MTTTKSKTKATQALTGTMVQAFAETEQSFKATKAAYKVDPTDTIWTRDTEDRGAESEAIALMAQEDWYSSHWGGGAIVDADGTPVGGFIYDNHPYNNDAHRREREHGILIAQLASHYGCNVVARSVCGEDCTTVVYTFDRYVPYSEIVVDLWVDIKKASIEGNALLEISTMRFHAYQEPRPRSRKSSDADGKSLAAE